MKTILFVATILLFCIGAHAQDDVKTISSNILNIRVEEPRGFAQWQLKPELNPDLYEVKLGDGEKKKVKFTTDVDSISFEVTVGSKFDFIVEFDDKLCRIRVVGIKSDPNKP